MFIPIDPKGGRPQPEQKPLAKGDKVQLRDGSEGTVQYLHPQMAIARVRVGDKTRTINLKELEDRA